MPYRIKIKVSVTDVALNKTYKAWRFMQCSDGTIYEFPTKASAVKIAQMCYPIQWDMKDKTKIVEVK